jgi:putative membrane protein
MEPTWGSYFPMFWIFPLLCVIFVVAMMFMMFRRGGMGCMPFGGGAAHRKGNRHDTARQILDRRYANGEISKEQYEQMRHDMESGPA